MHGTYLLVIDKIVFLCVLCTSDTIGKRKRKIYQKKNQYISKLVIFLLNNTILLRIIVLIANSN